MDHKPEDISRDSNFQLLLAFPNENPQDFIFKNLWPGGLLLKRYLLLLGVLIMVYFTSVIHSIAFLESNWEPIFYFSFLGIFLGLTITVLAHEMIQGWVFRKSGSRGNKYKWKIKNFTFYVLAKDFVYDKEVWRKITFYPLITINTLLISAFILFDTPLAYTFLVIAITHSLYCIKDMIIWDHLADKDNILIFDKEEDNTTYFFKKMFPAQKATRNTHIDDQVILKG